MTRHPISPARLVLGLALLGVALSYTLTAVGWWRLPLSLLLPLVPIALLLAGTTAAIAQILRPASHAEQHVDPPSPQD